MPVKSPSKSKIYRQQQRERLEAAEERLRDGLGLLWRIHSLSYVMSRKPRHQPELNDNLNVVAWRALITLEHAPDLTGQEITELWGLEKMGVNRAIQELIERGLAERSTDPADGRRLPLRLTEKGHQAVERLWQGASLDYGLLAKALTPKELEIFCRASDRLLAAAREITRPAKTR